MTQSDPLLEVRDLKVGFKTHRGMLEAVRGVSFTIESNQVLGVVGESGSGKSVAMLAILGLLPPNAVISGSAKYKGMELLNLPNRRMADIRGSRISMIFQDPLTSLNPVMRIGDQIAEAITLHDSKISKREALNRSLRLLELVSIPQPAERLKQYPHAFSGGMRQRAMIAMAVANNPELLVADEPTTALDVTVQTQVLKVLDDLRKSQGIGLILITHDLGLIAGTADNVTVMYSGKAVEFGTVDSIFYNSKNPYTCGLLASLPKLDEQEEILYSIEGTPPTLNARPEGCAFHPRCSYAMERCRVEEPDLRRVGEVWSACHMAEQVSRGSFVR